MKTTTYNPSDLEVSLARAIENMGSSLEEQLQNNNIVRIENEITKDNPQLRIYLEDADGDPHEVVIKIIQLPDKF